jgi:hypothetical protein
MKPAFTLRMLILVAVCPIALAGAALRQPAAVLQSPDQSNPESYRIFTESVINSESSERTERLAIESALIGAALAERQEDSQLAASLLIAASVLSTPDQKTQLWDTAFMLDPGIRDAWSTNRGTRSMAHERASVLLQNARYGQPLDPETLSDPDVRALLASAAESAGYDYAELNALLHAIAQFNESDPCRGRIFTPKRNPETRQIERVLCPEHARPNAALSSDEHFLMLLHIEMTIEDVPSTAWISADGTGSEPLRDPSISLLLEEYGLSIDRPYLRDQRWIASP